MKPRTRLNFEFRPQVQQHTLTLSLVKTDRGVILVGDTHDRIGPWTLVELFDDGKIAIHPRGVDGVGLVPWDWDAANNAYVSVQDGDDE